MKPVNRQIKFVPVVGNLNQLIKVSCVGGLLALGLTACQFQPLYSSDSATVGFADITLSRIAVAQVDTRPAQQVRNHLIFLMSGGSSPLAPSHEVRLRVTSTSAVLAAGIADKDGAGNFIASPGNTAGSVTLTASYELYDFAKKEIVRRGKRQARAAYDQTSQSFATERARRDAENRAAKEVAEQLRLAISADLSKG